MVKPMGGRNVCPDSNKLSVNSWSNSKPNCPRASVARAGTFTNVNMPSVQKFDEQVIEMAAEELIHNLDSGGRDELRRIEKALERLSEGTYGGLYVLWGRHPRSPAGGGAICRGVHRLRRDGYGIGNLCAGRTDRRGQNVEIPVFSMNQ